MSADVNIQTLFAQLRLEHFLVYLPGNGWRGAPESRGSRVRFELGADEAPYVLVLPSSNRAPQCKRLLQTAIYNLSGVEDRQPMEIIRDLLSVDTGTFPASRTEPSVRLRLRNLHPTQLTLQVASRSAEYLLMPGEVIEIDHPSEGGLIEVGFKGSTIQIDDLTDR